MVKDEDLLISILEAFKAGEISPGDIQRSWTSKGILFDPEEFKKCCEYLKSNNILIKIPTQNDNGRLMVNPNNDTLPFLLEKQKIRNKKNDNAAEIERLTILTLQLQADKSDLTTRLAQAQLNDIPKNEIHRNDVLIWQIIAGVSIAVAFLLKLFGAKGWI